MSIKRKVIASITGMCLTAILCAGAASPAFASVYECELNDTPNTADHAPSGTTINGTIYDSDDKDWFWFYAPFSGTLKTTAEATSGVLGIISTESEGNDPVFFLMGGGYATHSYHVSKGNHYIMMGGSEGYYSFSLTYTPSVKPAIAKTKAKKKAIKISMSKTAASYGGSKFQIQYKKKGASSWKSITTKSKTATIKHLKKGKKYKFRVRVVKTYRGEKYYSKWSKIKTSSKVK